jgi:ubiquinone biosynthesis protein COQ4
MLHLIRAYVRPRRQLVPICTCVQPPFSRFSTTAPPPPSSPPPLNHHVPTSHRQRGLLTVVSAVTALLDPKRADMVAALGETTGLTALATLQTTMRAHPVGALILQERPDLTETTLDLERLRLLPNDTFGGAYVAWMDKYNYSPNERPEVRYIEDEELAYIMQRYRQTHDFCHVLLDIPPTVLGEVVIKWFELAQTQLPMTFLSAMFGPFSAGPREWRLLLQSGAFSWASKVGTTSDLLLNVYFEHHMETKLVDVRKIMHLPMDGAPLHVKDLIGE